MARRPVMTFLSVFPVLVLAIINGLFSPYLLTVFALQGFWYPDFMPFNLWLVLTASSALLATLYVMVSGIPAALYEQLLGGRSASPLSFLIWFCTMAALTVPSLPLVLKALRLA